MKGKFFWASLVILVVVLAFLLPQAYVKLLMMKEVSTLGYRRVKMSVSVVDDAGMIKLYDGCMGVRMLITKKQAVSIARGLKGELKGRPNMHDIFATIAKNFGLKVVMVKVDDLKDGVYYAKLIVAMKGKMMGVDSRPSDAIAIAVRSDAPIYVKNSLLQNLCK